VQTAADYPRLWSADLREDVELCVSLAAQRGLETLVLDQTRPDIGLSVVKVIVPGLRHFWRRLAPGRLYEAPVELGWLSTPLREDQLNPISMFL
ncbi:MAG: YcaO-like family protein, partial [Candidatus Tectomicrobia bacterium]|nr:YcaO-like family protein [Candidatus Tectomicrobia bacterium]